MDIASFLSSRKKIIAISNYKISKETEEFASQYDCVIRFNVGSNPAVLQNYSFYNQKTDISVLSGWHEGNFGPLEGFKNQKILFSRPKCQPNILYHYKHICVDEKFENSIKQSCHIEYIPMQVFYDFYHRYDYDHPTTGLITLFYIDQILNLPIDSLNFLIDSVLYNTFENLFPKQCSHDLDKEKLILKNLNVKQYTILK